VEDSVVVPAGGGVLSRVSVGVDFVGFGFVVLVVLAVVAFAMASVGTDDWWIARVLLL